MSGMHLLPAYWTTNNQKKRKKKKTNPAKYEAGWRDHNKFLKRMRCSVITLDEYIDYCHGKGYPKGNSVNGSTSVSKTESGSSNLSSSAKPYRRNPDLPECSNRIGGIASKKEIPVYTGNAVIGQAYNKGGLQVLSAEEVKDPMTGKRR